MRVALAMLGLFLLSLPSLARSLPSESQITDAMTRDTGTESPRYDFKRYRLAQADDDSYDPFSDYSEFDEDSDEEADTYFFKHGRLLTVGFDGGYKGFTGTLNNIYTSGSTYGLFLCYFFDLRFALQLSFATGDYPFSYSTLAGKSTSGSVSFTAVSLDVKYYFNTQNVSKGLADVNPYIILGPTYLSRTYTFSSSTTNSTLQAPSTAYGLDLGAGAEFPIMKRKAYFGLQALLRYVNFSDDNSPVYLHDYNAYATQVPSGYQYDVTAILGVNF